MFASGKPVNITGGFPDNLQPVQRIRTHHFHRCQQRCKKFSLCPPFYFNSKSMCTSLCLFLLLSGLSGTVCRTAQPANPSRAVQLPATEILHGAHVSVHTPAGRNMFEFASSHTYPKYQQQYCVYSSIYMIISIKSYLILISFFIGCKLLFSYRFLQNIMQITSSYFPLNPSICILSFFFCPSLTLSSASLLMLHRMIFIYVNGVDKSHNTCNSNMYTHKSVQK